MKIKRLEDLVTSEPFETDDEWLILSHSIMSTSVLGAVYRKYKIGQVKVKHFDSHFRIVFRWLLKHYRDYEKAPKGTIQEIFVSYKKSLGTEKTNIIEEYLDRLADEYVVSTESGVDPDYIIKEVMPRFIRAQEAALLIDKLQTQVENGQFDKIDDTIAGYTHVTEEDSDPDIGTIKPGSIRTVRRYFSQDREQGALFRMPGAIGDFMGPIYRHKLYAITGVEKSGKTHFMQEIGYQAVRFNRLKVLDINLEMNEEEKAERFWQRLGCYAADDDHAGNLVVPVFDCENNQNGRCEVLKRTPNKYPLLDSPDDAILYEERKSWKICTKCRSERYKANTKKTKRFIPTIWYEPSRIYPLTEMRMVRTINKAAPYGISNFRTKCFPRFSVTFDDVWEYIKLYVAKKNFKPDLILLDYPDIMRPVQGEIMDRFNIDYNWKRCARLGQEMDCAVIAADQANKQSRTDNRLTVMSTTESKTKDAHLDMRLTLNQTALERALGLQRLGMLFRRKGRLLSGEIMMLQRMETCDPLLDSEWWIKPKNDYRAINFGQNLPELFN